MVPLEFNWDGIVNQIGIYMFISPMVFLFTMEISKDKLEQVPPMRSADMGLNFIILIAKQW